METASHNYRKLATLAVNVVRWDINQQWRKAMRYFVDERIRDDANEDPGIGPADFEWREFEVFIAHRLKYNCLEHAVVFAQYGVRDGRAREVFDADTWRSTLNDITGNRPVVLEGAELFFLVMPRHSSHGPKADMGAWFDVPYRIKVPTNIAEMSDVELPQIVEHFVGDIEESGVETGGRRPSSDSGFLQVPKLRRQGAVRRGRSPARRPSSEVRSVMVSLPPIEVQVEQYLESDYDGCEVEVEFELSDSDSSDDDSEGCVYEEANTATYRPVHADEISQVERNPFLFPPDSDSDYSEDEFVTDTAGTTPSSKTSGSPGSAQRASKSVVSGRPVPSSVAACSPSKPSTRGGTVRDRASTQGRTTPMSSLPATTRNTKTTRFSLLSKISSTATTAAKTPTLRRESASLSSPAVNPTSASTYVNLIDMLKSEYYTSQIADADYGAVEETNPVLDTYLGSYNTGNTEAEWRACLEFFNVNVAEYMKREAIAGGDGQQRKRVPMKKLPGTTVGLFDYQLMGVCNLLRFVLADVSGGLLCDEQGLGKTQEMYGLIAFAAALRRCKAEVKAAWRKAAKWNDKKKGSPSQHNRPGAVAARSCPFDERYGFKCYCWHQPTRELADRLPDGPNVLVVPARSCASMVRDAKTKLDVKQFKIRGFHEGGDKEDKLTSADVSALRATITATQGEAGPVYQYQAAPDSEYLIVVSPEYIPRLNGLFGVELKVPNAAGKVKKSALVPGMILMDEFHEYAISKNGDESRVAAWLQHLKKCCLDSQQPTPLIYFVSGTPLGDTPANIRSAISLLEKDAWQNEAHPLNGATVESLDELTQTFDRLTGVQASGEMVPESEIVDYRRRLDRVLEHTMVRRLGTDQFQGRNLTDLGPLKVNIMDHQLPFSLIDSLQALADQTREQVVVAATSRGISVARLLRSKDGEALLLKLRLASIFPGIADPSSGAAFTFTTTEIHAHLAAAKGDVTKTPYFAHIPAWSASSPKLATLTQAIRTMLADKSPIPGSPTTSKKYCIFTPLESEAVLIQAYLLLSRAHPTTSSGSNNLRGLKPVLLTSNMLQSARQRVLDQFLTEGNAPPNVLVAPMALAGTGLNLQRAKYSTVTGPAWTKRENQQAYYRIHRVGQRQATQLQLLTARWNPAERVVLAGYEGKEVKGKEGMWEVGNWFCEGEGDEGDWWGGISGEVSE